MIPINDLKQPIKCGNGSAIRSVRKVREFVLGNHKEYVTKLEWAADEIYEERYDAELNWSDVSVQKAYECFLYNYLPSLKLEEHWMEHRYVAMCQSRNDS